LVPIWQNVLISQIELFDKLHQEKEKECNALFGKPKCNIDTQMQIPKEVNPFSRTVNGEVSAVIDIDEIFARLPGLSL
jgi:hypothetical protein